MDVKTAFLNGDLEEEIYMNQPEVFIAPGQEGTVCRLVKSSYCLKQAPKQLHQKFDHAMLESLFKINERDNGYMFTLGGAAISWKLSKQTVIAKSTMKSKFIALDKCGEEAEWLRQFVKDIPRWPKSVTAISIHYDSQSEIGRAQSTMYNGKSRHICHRHNSIRQLLSTGVILVDYVASKDNIADPFTKGLSRELVIFSVRVVNVNESLGLLEYNKEGEMWVCGVWMRKDGVNQPFTKIYTLKMVFNTSILGFRNNGDVISGIVGDDYKESTLEVYEPSSGHINGVGIKGDYGTISASSTWKHYSCLINQILSFKDSEDGLQGVRIKL
nr:ribonuclease H-like domain containing protein [Tanacetum cinerariifolium]